MAVRHGYGKIAGTDALVFAYDTGDTVNSFKGRPTTNYGPVSFGSWGTENTAQRIATGNTYNGQPTYNCRTTLGASWQGIDTTISGLRTAAGTGGTVTMSCMVRNNNSTAYPMYAYIGHDFSSTRTIAANSDWQKVQWTVNQSNMNNDYVEFRPYTNTDGVYLEMTMPMVEVNVTYASQFVNGTRSATQGLLDLTGNRTVDLSNMSYDSNAQPVLDGSDDLIQTSIGTNSLGTVASFEFIMNCDNVQKSPVISGYIGASPTENRWDIQLDRWGNDDIRFVFHADESGVVSNTTFSTGTYYHIVFTVDTLTDIASVYVNGVLDNTSAANQGLNTGVDIKIGAGDGTNYAGELPVVKIYNRALTADEIRTNYVHYKGRYQI